MDTIVVTTNKFPTSPEGNLELCNGQPGSAFANWLRDHMISLGYSCDELIQEDYGWGYWINRNDITVWTCVSYAAADDDVQGEWFVSVNFEIPFQIFRPKLWGKSKEGKALQVEVFDAVSTYISQAPDINVWRKE